MVRTDASVDPLGSCHSCDRKNNSPSHSKAELLQKVHKEQNFFPQVFRLGEKKNNMTVWVQLPSHPSLPLLILLLLSPPFIAVN